MKQIEHSLSETPSLPPKKPNRPKLHPFFQQTLPSTSSHPTLLSTVLIFCLTGIVFIIIGVVSMAVTAKVKFFETRYDSECNDSTCRFEIDLDSDMEAPVYLYLEMRNFYQNHWNVVKSVSYWQLQGEDLETEDLVTCAPTVTYDDAELKDVNYTTPTEDDDDPMYPCGLLPRSYAYAQDRFRMFKGGSEITIDEGDIAWEADMDYRYFNLDNWRKKQWVDVEDEHFAVWMRTANLPWFIKLWGSIDEDLDEGKYSFIVTNGED
mmetsp:Transcript_27417/g.49379  ORF Transcript_27417/g.49379 Transcript_27417/m.49379 type:complete len:264 (+) Transcript_27417:1111-1902(+)